MLKIFAKNKKQRNSKFEMNYQALEATRFVQMIIQDWPKSTQDSRPVKYVQLMILHVCWYLAILWKIQFKSVFILFWVYTDSYRYSVAKFLPEKNLQNVKVIKSFSIEVNNLSPRCYFLQSWGFIPNQIVWKICQHVNETSVLTASLFHMQPHN